MQDVYEIKVQKLLHVVPPIWKAKETPTSVFFFGGKINVSSLIDMSYLPLTSPLLHLCQKITDKVNSFCPFTILSLIIGFHDISSKGVLVLLYFKPITDQYPFHFSKSS